MRLYHHQNMDEESEFGYMPEHNPEVLMYRRSGGYALQKTVQDIHVHVPDQSELMQKNTHTDE